MKYNLKTLPNKLRLITIPMSDLESATVLVLVGAGARYEDEKNNGVAHFAEHMFFKGTEKRPTTTDISSEIDSLGADFNAFTDKEYTGYYVKSSNKHLEKSVEILADMLLNSKFEEEEIEREKKVIIEEINMYTDTPIRHIGDIYESLIYSPNPLGFDTAGTKEVVQSLTRKDITSYVNTYYHPSNMIVVISGGIDEETARGYVTKYFNFERSGEIPGYKAFIDTQSAPLLKIHGKKTDQAHFCLGVRSYKIGHPDRYTLAVFNTIMGSNMSSRLFIEVRERRGLCYYISSNNESHLDTGTWVIQSGVDVSRIQEAITTCLTEMSKITKEEVTEKELTKAKEYLKGKLALGLEDSKGVANLYGSGEIFEKKIRTPQEIMAGIDAVTSADILRVARDIIREDKLALAVTGPYDDEESFRSILKLS